MENNIKICICGKEYINGHLGQCKEYRQSLKNIENNITYDYLYKSYIEEGKSLKYISTELGLSKTRILDKKLNEFNITKRTLQEAKKQKHHIELSKQTSFYRYGVDFHLQSGTIFREKAIETINEKYGVNNVMHSDIILNNQKEYFQSKYGVNNPFGSDIIKEKIKKTNIKKYGVDNPWKLKEIQQKCQETKLNSNKPSVYFSKQSQQLFWSIYDKLPKELQDHCYFAELNKEYGRYDQENKKYYFYDFVITNIKYCIEYNGNYYHANPEKYDESFYNKHLNLTSKEIWNKDKIKNDFLINDGFSLDIVWENTENELVVDSLINNILQKETY